MIISTSSQEVLHRTCYVLPPSSTSKGVGTLQRQRFSPHCCWVCVKTVIVSLGCGPLAYEWIHGFHLYLFLIFGFGFLPTIFILREGDMGELPFITMGPTRPLNALSEWWDGDVLLGKAHWIALVCTCRTPNWCHQRTVQFWKRSQGHPTNRWTS